MTIIIFMLPWETVMSSCSSSAVSSCQSRQSRSISHPGALRLQTLILLAFLAASSAPTPLYSVYRDAWGFSAITLTVIFGVYAIALLLALLVLGSLSDHIGRRPVIIGALLIEAVAMVAFMAATSVPLLILARLIQGVATGAATSVL